MLNVELNFNVTMESMKRTFFLTCLFLMACLGMQAQNLQVSGTVISKSDDLPVIGATVLEKCS